MKKLIIPFFCFSLIVLSLSCASRIKTAIGAAIGAAGGAVVGCAIGIVAGNTLIGIITGAAIGGAAGAFIGELMDKQAEEMRRDLEGARIERIGEGIKITFNAGLLFDVDKYELRPQSKENLRRLAAILNKYPDTNIIIEGHTDSTGNREYNLLLSERRARAVAAYLAELGVSSSRFSIMGYGLDQPVSSNDTAEGRQQNRRVDLGIIANEKLQRIARERAGR